jgi:hypothetical protein
MPGHCCPAPAFTRSTEKALYLYFFTDKAILCDNADKAFQTAEKADRQLNHKKARRNPFLSLKPI